MAIHHATAKRADKLNVKLNENDARPSHQHYAAEHAHFVLHAGDVKALVDECAAIVTLISNYPSFKWNVEEDDTVTIAVPKYRIEVKGQRAIHALELAVAAWMEAIANEDEAGEGDEEEEEIEAEVEEKSAGGSVVPNRYRVMYAEAGHVDNCGDWMADWLKSRTVKDDGRADITAIDILAGINEISLDKYDRTNRGWEGRLRMTFGNILRAKVAKTGKVKDYINAEPTEIDAPAEWMAEMAEKAARRKMKNG